MNRLVGDIFVGLSIIGFVIFVVLLWCRFESKNRGYHFGYYGELNKLVYTLDTLPEVNAVTNVQYNSDLTLEEIALDIETADGGQLRLVFGQNDPIRELGSQDMSKALKEKIEKTSRQIGG